MDILKEPIVFTCLMLFLSNPRKTAYLIIGLLIAICSINITDNLFFNISTTVLSIILIKYIIDDTKKINMEIKKLEKELSNS